MRRRLAWIAGAMALSLNMAVAAMPCRAQDKPLIQHTFETSTDDWKSLSELTGTGNGKIRLTHEAANVKMGMGALQFDYTLKQGEFAALLLPTPDGALTKMKSLHFWIKADHTTSFIIQLQEKEGGRYNASFAVTQGKWQQVDLASSDFSLDESKDAPKDPDGKLDLDKVENLAISDFGIFFSQLPDQVQTFLDFQPGARTLYLDEFVVNETALPDSRPTENGELILDKFLRPQVGWLGAGNVSLALSNDKPLTGPGLKASYIQKQMKLEALIKQIPKGALAHAKNLRFSIASEKPVKLSVQVEEADGGKYFTLVDIPGNREVKEFTLSFTDGFSQTDDSKDPDGKLDLDQVTQILFIDIAGLMGSASDQENTLWINKLRVSK